MNVILETAADFEQDWAEQRGLLDGTYLSLSKLVADRRPLFEVLEGLCVEGESPVFVELPLGTPEEHEALIERMAAFSERAVPVLTASDDALQLVTSQVRAGRRAALLCCSPSQALLAARAGAQQVLIPASLGAAGVQCAQVARDCMDLIEAADLAAQVVLTGLETFSEVLEAVSLGLSVATTRRALQAGLEHPANAALASEREGLSGRVRIDDV